MDHEKRLWMSLGMVAVLGQAHASTRGIEYNIANGLSPIAKDQSISVLQPFMATSVFSALNVSG